MNDLIVTLKDHIRSAWRFRWQALLTAWLLTLLGWGMVFITPDKYQSEAKVYVDTESVLRPLLQGLAVQTDLGQRLQLMTRTLLNNENLEKVLREADLDLEATTVTERQEMIDQLRETVSIETQRRQNFYTISYEYKDPYVAKKVVETLLNIFVEAALGDTRVESDTAQKFLTEQIKDYEARLVKAESRLTEFKRRNVDTMPGQSGGVFSQLQSAQSQLQDVDLELKERRIRRDELKRQYERTAAEENERRRQGQVVAETPTGRRILAMETRLDELLLRYTDAHPDVQELKSTIAELKAQQKGAVVMESPANQTISTALEELKLAYRQAEVNLTAVRLRQREYQKRIDELKLKLDVLPKVEAELTRLNRDYEINRTNYQELVQRLESAKMSEQADEAGDNVKFRIVEPPKVPLLPVGPKRILLSLGVLMLGLAAGGGVAFLISQFKPVYYDTSLLNKESGFPVLGQVSRVWTSNLMLKRRVEVVGFSVSLAMLLVVCVAILLTYQMGYREEIVSNLKLLLRSPS
ncbi:MAG: chain length-determining protein [Candidatus Thiodiazotropha sp. (ex Myrtea sp. 'scaly one' KF741663)]|nr:chain length-determining protein [Candidatus Thiodiazotropha sp. (ex Myrtea sp. 'scaly one' KF741663)]